MRKKIRVTDKQAENLCRVHYSGSLEFVNDSFSVSLVPTFSCHLSPNDVVSVASQTDL